MLARMFVAGVGQVDANELSQFTGFNSRCPSCALPWLPSSRVDYVPLIVAL